ncbi:MAG: hypothetical protein U0599_01060 [Vicinamibacteria bacterium]
MKRARAVAHRHAVARTSVAASRTSFGFVAGAGCARSAPPSAIAVAIAAVASRTRSLIACSSPSRGAQAAREPWLVAGRRSRQRRARRTCRAGPAARLRERWRRPSRRRACAASISTRSSCRSSLLDPSLVGRPVIVGGSRSRGVVTSASYEVRPLGVRSGMPTAQAARLAPAAVFLPTRHGVYSPHSARVRAILDRFSPEVRAASIDEFFVDFAGCETLYAEPGDAAADATIARVVWRMRDSVQAELGLPSSAGVGGTRMVAKIASGLAKPAGVLMVPIGEEESRFAPLPDPQGPRDRTRHREPARRGRSAHDRPAPPPASGPLRTRFGAIADGVRRGLDASSPTGARRDRPAFLEQDAKHETVGSISNEHATFSADVADRGEVERQGLPWPCASASAGGRGGARPWPGRWPLKMRYSDFETLARSRTLDRPTNERKTVYGGSTSLLAEAWTRRRALRLVGVALANLSGPSRQLGLFEDDRGHRPVASAIDAVRERFGYDAIRLGTTGPSRWLEQRPAAAGPPGDDAEEEDPSSREPEG